MTESSYRLCVERLGPLPLVNHFLDRLGLEEAFERRVPTDDPRCRLSHAQALGVLLRSIIVERELGGVDAVADAGEGGAMGAFSFAIWRPEEVSRFRRFRSARKSAAL